MTTDPTWGSRARSVHSIIGLPATSTRPLSSPPMRRACPPARITPVMRSRSIIRFGFLEAGSIAEFCVVDIARKLAVVGAVAARRIRAQREFAHARGARVEQQ